MSSWYAYLAHTIPDLLYLSLYSLLMFYWARMHALYSRGSGAVSAWRWLPFVVLNVVAYAAYVAAAVITHRARNSHQFATVVEYAQGGLYTVGLLLLAHYGSRVVRQLKLPPQQSSMLLSTDTPTAYSDSDVGDSDRSGEPVRPSKSLSYGSLDGSYQAPLRFAKLLAELRRRVMMLCALCLVVFLLRAVQAWLVATQAITNVSGYPNLHSRRRDTLMARYVYDTITLLVVEFLPAIAMLHVLSPSSAMAAAAAAAPPTEDFSHFSAASGQSRGSSADDTFSHVVIGTEDVSRRTFGYHELDAATSGGHSGGVGGGSSRSIPVPPSGGYHRGGGRGGAASFASASASASAAGGFGRGGGGGSATAAGLGGGGAWSYASSPGLHPGVVPSTYSPQMTDAEFGYAGSIPNLSLAPSRK